MNLDPSLIEEFEYYLSPDEKVLWVAKSELPKSGQGCFMIIFLVASAVGLLAMAAAPWLGLFVLTIGLIALGIMVREATIQYYLLSDQHLYIKKHDSVRKTHLKYIQQCKPMGKRSETHGDLRVLTKTKYLNPKNYRLKTKVAYFELINIKHLPIVREHINKLRAAYDDIDFTDLDNIELDDKPPKF